MYLNILKRDLKRKKTMNAILLLFAILAAMFVSSGISNVVNVMNGTEYYLNLAGVGDYIVVTQTRESGVEDIVKSSEYVDSYRKEDVFWGELEQLKINGKECEAKSQTILLQTLNENGIKYFHTDNTELKAVNPGEIYVTAGFLKYNDAKIGDTLTIDCYGIKKSLIVAGEMKDALLGSDMMGNSRFIMNEQDYIVFETEETRSFCGNIFYIVSDDTKSLASEFSDCSGILFSNNRMIVKLSYVMEMLVAMIVLVLSICLCVVSFVLIKFVISFTINEEFREIGVMKAIGIRNVKIRSLYLTKYFAIALIGGLIGFVLGIPFGKVLIASVSSKLVLSNDLGIMLNVLGTVFVIAVMTGFAYLCTGKVKKYTPVDAIRNGSVGERYAKKAKISLARTGLKNALFMALNDVLCAPKRYLTIILSFFLCSVFVFGLVEVKDTMLSDRLITTFGKKSDVYIDANLLGSMELISEDGDEALAAKIDAVEEDLKKLGIPGKVTKEIGYKYKTVFNGKDYSLAYQQNKRLHASEYEYTEGSAPETGYEIAITPQISEQTGAKIGDSFIIDFGSEKRECLIVGYFQTMNQVGSVIRLHEDAPTSMLYASTLMSGQIDFDDHPDASVIRERIDILKDFYNTKDVYDAAEYCDKTMGVAGTMDMVSKCLLLITCVVVLLVTVMMECSFISDESGQIALLKSIGFTNSFIIKWQVYRFFIVAAFAELLAIALTHPVTKLWCDPIWKMMGATNVSYYFKPLSLLVVYPGIILCITLVSVWLTAGRTKRITCTDTGNVE